MCHTLEKRIRETDVEFVTDWIISTFEGERTKDIALTESKYLVNHAKYYQDLRYKKQGRETLWADDDWRMWFEVQLRSLGWEPWIGKSSDAKRMVVLLNVFFIHLEETELHLSRLRHYKHEEINPTLATPGIERTNQVVTPVDIVASRVVKGDDQ